ncbi:acyl--CoA ligase [Nocardia colli]|uniref:Acyl--CoA ligase n=1 Tax=Nocardia colli TaxID=2545717 RepID=A0A5N0DV38_9NOCA|nr:class I adenylate-forming enzyme family protein [Nocardia colli]KAA8880613.1 acyl--CoA ligase [Nocardia colli]
MVDDLVPRALRQEWTSMGWCPGRDVFGLFTETTERDPDKIAVIDDAGSITYRRLHHQARQVAQALRAEGVGAGDVVGICLPNRREVCVVELAVAALGAVSVAFPVGYREREIRGVLTRSRAVAWVTVAAHHDFSPAAVVRAAMGELPDLRMCFVLGAEVPGCSSLDAVLADPGEPAAITTPGPDSSGPARIMVTSGTEREPKLVVYHHDALVGGIANQLTVIGVDSSTRLMLLPPICSGFGALATFGVLARHGATLVLTSTFDPAAVLRLLNRHRVAVLCAVPTMTHDLLDHATAVTAAVRLVYLAGAPIAPALIDRTSAAFGCTVVSAYGSSDGAFCCTHPDDPPDKVATTVGRPSDAVCSFKIMDPGRDEERPVGEIGEIWARGPVSPLCYADSPELDRRYRDPLGWTKTGDLGAVDAEGYLHVTDRLKDIIVRGGVNISPAEIESELLTHPAVARAACAGIPDERLGERLCAWITMHPAATAPTLADLRAHLTRRGLAKFQLPEDLRIVDRLPTGPSGKVLRRVLRASADAWAQE